ncbi:hypothetical protein [Nocardia cyriacigeorgica]|uniref:hypothetical protein n=1 Tax=Nocardia cyriacigeorgica TaxID=135487 RepID=UPI001893EDF8|nr:hypothetical protein [Nocardia cyriacigeorgica]MBF6435005.1 hypothetical protein [Nocardia cyriacigeorgica]MBF6454915.1 hypothetical protein [Nocardia cyriacigeorgica]MBF6480889.1 hypothetical protein [Nocardia cyriacigeorgica]MBF6552810.1 hypothetical protein [Nocardia cyriacigeorgica]
MADSQRWADERWPEVRDDTTAAPRRGRGVAVDEPDDDYDWPRGYDEPATRRIVNPYAVIALVAALLLLIPVAIVFGLIAFSHPRGRVMALFALLLGLAEAAVIAALLVLPGDLLSDVVSRTEDLASTQTSQTAWATAASATGPAAGGPPEHAGAPEATTGAPASGAEPAGPAAPTAVLRTACPEAGLIGTAADGSTLLCLTAVTSTTGFQWKGPYTISEVVGEGGTSCNPGVAATARTADGRALVCEGQGRSATWVLWTA